MEEKEEKKNIEKGTRNLEWSFGQHDWKNPSFGRPRKSNILRPKFKNVPISNFVIQKWVDYLKIPNFNGVFSRDHITSFRKLGCYVINLNESHEPGSHWIAIHIKPKKIEYFDSFAVKPTQEVVTLASKLKKKYIYNTTQLQHLYSVTCGYFCLYYVLNSCKFKRSFHEIVRIFDPKNHVVNEAFIKKYFQSL